MPGLTKLAPTRERADALIDQWLKGSFAGGANDHVYQWDASRDYYPSPGLERIRATLPAINSADDERNPPELGLLDKEIKRVKNGRAPVIPGSADTFGHGTTDQAKFWKDALADVLKTAPKLAD